MRGVLPGSVCFSTGGGRHCRVSRGQAAGHGSHLCGRVGRGDTKHLFNQFQAVTGIPAQLKRLLPDYKRMEEKIDAVIREKYGLPPVMSTPVKYADLIMLATERRDLGLDDGSFWPVLEGIPATEMFNVIPLAPGHAYGMFMERFNELSELRKCA